MPTVQFTIQPAVLVTLFPYFIRWLWRYSVAAVLVYAVLWLLTEADIVTVSRTALIVSLIGIVLIASTLSIKHRLIKTHRTQYIFYDTHVVKQVSVLSVKRQSMPYSHISKVTNNSSLFQRIIGVSDIILHAVRDSEQDFILSSIRNPDDVEHKIYMLLKKQKHKD